MALLGMQDITIAFGGPPVLDHAAFSMERGERVCLLGRNGAGKSTVMKLLDETITPDSGEIVRQTGITVARLEQQVPPRSRRFHLRCGRRRIGAGRPAARPVSPGQSRRRDPRQ